MIYFITYPDSQSHWQTMYNACVESEFRQAGIPFEKYVVDFFAPDCQKTLLGIQMIESRREDIWLFAWAQNPLIEAVEQKPGRKFGHAHGLGCFDFEPAVLMGVDLGEHARFGYYEKVFLNSEWSFANATLHYPEHTERFVITGFPMDYTVFAPYGSVPKEPGFVVFNQRFALERAPTFVIELSRQLSNLGYRVAQLSGESMASIAGRNPDLGRLLRLAPRVGLEFIWNQTKQQYHANLAKASVAITTSLCDNLPVSMLEAIYMGATPVAPRSFCFPEFVHDDNLYTPYSLPEIVRLVQKAPKRNHRIGCYSKQVVIARYLEVMGLS